MLQVHIEHLPWLHYRPAMDFDDELRGHLREAQTSDTKGTRNQPRSWRRICFDAGLEGRGYNQFMHFLNQGKRMDYRRLERVWTELGIRLEWLTGGTRRLSEQDRIPVVKSGRFPVGASKLELRQQLLDAKLDEFANLTEDPDAFWILLEESFDRKYVQGDWVLVSPGTTPRPGEPLAAVAGQRFVIGRLKSSKDREWFELDSGRLFEAGEFVVLGPLPWHLNKQRPSS